MSKKVTRLFEQLAPEHYKLHIDIHPSKESFSGSVTIKGRKTGRPSKRITLHQKDLKISSATLTKHDKKSGDEVIELTRIVPHAAYDEVRLHAQSQLYPGDYTVTLEFSGKITDNMEGIYPCRFMDGDLEKKLIATQFESHAAREVFPCIDEPEAKAVFQLNLTHDAGEVALSNTEPVETVDNDGRPTTTYADTPLMSTYLLAFVVGDMQYREARSKQNNVLIRTYTTPNQVGHSEFALDVAAKCMDFYEEYYDIPFPLSKCDFVALPDFANGAMENWGLITFREQAMLVSPETSLSSKQWVALVVAHELTHQWFGNLVTMQWWTDLWLNEGFASWMEYLAVDHFFPEWHLWTQFSVDEQQHALKLDALEHTHPVEVPVNHPDEIRSIFDAISYQKGASVIHMLHDYLGAAAFRDGLRHYLKKFAYKNTVTTDLWEALEHVSGKPVREFMHAWTAQPGYPLVKVDAKDNHLVVEQQRFVSNPRSTKRDDDLLWPVPLLADGLDVDTTTKQTQNVAFNTLPTKINASQRGFYRTDYSHKLQQKQLSALDTGALDEVDRMGLLADGFDVTKAGYQSVSVYLDLLAHLKGESALPVWEIIAGSLATIRATLSANDEDNQLRDAMKPFMRDLVAKQYKRLGWNPVEGEAHLDTLLRPLIVGMAVGADDPDAVGKAEALYQDKIDNNTAINPDLRSIVYSHAARHGNAETFNQLIDIYRTTTSSDEKLNLTSAVTSFEDESAHQKMLDHIISNDVRSQDIGYWIAYAMMNRYGRAASWQWIQGNWDELKKLIGGDLSFYRLPVYVARTFATDELLQEYKNYFEPKLEPALERSYHQGIEMIETAIEWKSRDTKAALDWFTKTH